MQQIPFVVRYLALTIVLAMLAACAPITVELPATQTAQPITMGDLTITPLPVAPDDVAEILGMYRWRFRLSAPETATDLRMRLVLEHHDAEPEIIADFGTSGMARIDEDVLVALYPVDGPIFQADKLQYFVRSNGSSTTGLIDNPAVEFSILQPHQPAEPTDADGLKLLTLGQEHNFEGISTFILQISIDPNAFDTPNQPQPTPQADDSGDVSTAPEATTPISIGAPGAFATEAIVEDVPGYDESSAPPWAIYPSHQQIRLVDYVLGETFHEARVWVYPTHAFSEMNPVAAQAIAQLQEILADQPDLAGISTLPFLPVFNAAQQLHAQESYLDWGEVSGIRYLTQYAQAFNPINNNELFYTFQGLSEDGRFYVAALLPVQHPDLPANYEEAPKSYADDFATYIADVTAALNAADAESFHPNLTALDEWIATLSINE